MEKKCVTVNDTKEKFKKSPWPSLAQRMMEDKTHMPSGGSQPCPKTQALLRIHF